MVQPDLQVPQVLLEQQARQVPLGLKALLDLKARQVQLALQQQWQLARSLLELLDLAQRFQTVALPELLFLTSLFRRALLVLKVPLVRKARLVQLAQLALKAQQAASRLALSPHLALAVVPLLPTQATPALPYLTLAFLTAALVLQVLLEQHELLDLGVLQELLGLKALKARRVHLVVQRLSICSALLLAMLTLEQAN